MSFAAWTPDDPAQVIDLRADQALAKLARYYQGSHPDVVHEVLGQAYTLGAQTCVIEYRYLDPDYRSEHSRFYSTTFRRYPSVGHRLHFFVDAPPADLLADPEKPADFGAMDYLGYTVFRPLPGARVGRTMLRPPPDLAERVFCQASDSVNVFGQPMTVTGTPFMAQDAQLGVCAHMTLWVTGYHHHLAYGDPRQLAADVADAIPVSMGLGRPSPSTGLKVDQITAASYELGRPSLLYECDHLPSGESIPRVACRYLNSGMPVIVAAGGRHAFVLVGYWRDDPGEPEEKIRFIAQDDERGPYHVVEDFANDAYGPWDHLVVPLPPKVFVPGEVAEEIGRERLLSAAAKSGEPETRQIVDHHQLDKSDDLSIAFRSTVMRSNRFKETMHLRGASDNVVALYRRMQLPRWIWVIEAIRRAVLRGAANRV